MQNPQISREKDCTEGPGKVPVPRLSQRWSATAPSAVELRAELERATTAGDWVRVAELARMLADLPT